MITNAQTDTQEDRRIDWAAAHEKLEANMTRLQAGEQSLSEEALQKIWERRAAQLAQTPETEDQGEQVALLIVRLGTELYGLNAQHVYRMQPLSQVTPVPRVPEWIAGVTNIRGRIMSVFDLQCFFNLSVPETELSATQRNIVVVQTPEMELALLAQEILEVRAFPMSQLHTATEDTIRGISKTYIQGILSYDAPTQNNGNEHNANYANIIVLNIRALLADENIIIREE